MTVRNISLNTRVALAVGYIFRNAKGQEIASTNSQIEGLAIEPINQGEHITVRIKVELPCLHPGSYAFSMTAGYINETGDISLSDRIENAVVLELLSDKRVHVMMSFPTTIDVEV